MPQCRKAFPVWLRAPNKRLSTACASFSGWSQTAWINELRLLNQTPQQYWRAWYLLNTWAKHFDIKAVINEALGCTVTTYRQICQVSLFFFLQNPIKLFSSGPDSDKYIKNQYDPFPTKKQNKVQNYSNVLQLFCEKTLNAESTWEIQSHSNISVTKTRTLWSLLRSRQHLISKKKMSIMTLPADSWI